MPNSNDREDDGGPVGTVSEKRLAEMIDMFMERWGDTSRKLQEASEDRLERVNGMAAALSAPSSSRPTRRTRRATCAASASRRWRRGSYPSRLTGIG